VVLTASAQTSPRSARRASERKRYGSETPRIWTPPLRELTPETSLGFAVIDFAEHVCGIELFPWQRWLLIHALELNPDDSGSFRFRNIVVLVARQNGKSTLSQVLSLFALYVLGIDLVLGTAQDLDTAEEVWEGALDIIEETPELAALADKPIRVNGKKTIRLLTGERYKVKAANRRAGRGLSSDLILLDELREHTTWDAWGAITKTTRARQNPQVWALSNAGDASSLVLRHLRVKAHAALGDPDGIGETADGPLVDSDGADELEELLGDDLEDGLAIFEWSAPPGCAIDDRDGWAQSNPSLGYMITERTIASEMATDPEWVFRTEVLCQWSEGSLVGPFPPGSWEAGTDPESRMAAETRRAWCVDVSHDRGMAYIAVAGFRSDGDPHVEVVAQRAGTAWVSEWFTEKDSRRQWPVTVQWRGAPASSLIPDLEAVGGLTLIEWQGSALGAATGAFYDSVRAETAEGEQAHRVWHRPQPVLDVAAATAVIKPLGESYVWSRAKSPTDAAPLIAVTGALWALNQGPDIPAVSVYEERGLVTL
jgi:hypothetical protein